MSTHHVLESLPLAERAYESIMVDVFEFTVVPESHGSWGNVGHTIVVVDESPVWYVHGSYIIWTT